MDVYLPVVQYAYFMFDDSTDEENNIIEKIENFAEITVPNMNDHQFKMHFRMTPTTFEDLICKATRVARTRANNVNHVGHPRMNIEKEFLIVIWCLSNLEFLDLLTLLVMRLHAFYIMFVFLMETFLMI
jgi:hypothetical protein